MRSFLGGLIQVQAGEEGRQARQGFDRFPSLLAGFDLTADLLHVVITEVDVVLHAFQPVFVDHELVFHLVDSLFERTVLGG